MDKWLPNVPYKPWEVPHEGENTHMCIYTRIKTCANHGHIDHNIYENKYKNYQSMYKLNNQQKK